MKSGNIGFLLSVFYFAYVIALSIRILLRKREPQIIISWILTLFFLPYIGVVFYILFGIDRTGRNIIRNIPEDFFLRSYPEILEKQDAFISRIRTESDDYLYRTISLLISGGHSVITVNNDITLQFSGAEHFHSLLQDVRGAQKSIFLEYFIWRSDDLGWEILEELQRKADAGVDVRIIFDGVGCFFTLSRRYRRALRSSRIGYRYFLDPRNFFQRRFVNYRNHRKIAVIDNRVGYTGGMNMGREYATGGKRFPSWRDTHLRMTGDGVKILQGIFEADWSNSGGGVPEPVQLPDPLPVLTGIPMQIVCSGPDSRWDTLRKLYLTMITGARRYVYIQSPYFVPDGSLINALETAALSGIDVRLMLTGLADKRIPFWVARTYFEGLLDAGVRIYYYTAGFLHAKTLSADGEIATVGSCNLDVRSLQIDYELNAVFYDREKVAELDDQFGRDLTLCREITGEEVRKYSFLQRLRNSICKILAPLL